MALPKPTFRSSNLVAPDLTGAIRGVGQLSQAFAGLEDKARGEYNILAKEKQAAADEAYRQELLGFKQRAEEQANQERAAKQAFYQGMQKGPQEISGGITNAWTPEYDKTFKSLELTPDELEAQKTGNYTDFNQAAEIQRKMEEQAKLGDMLTSNYVPQYEARSEQVNRVLGELGESSQYIPDIAYKEAKAAQAADIAASKTKQESLQKLIDAADKRATQAEEKSLKFKTTHNNDGSTKGSGSKGSASKFGYTDFLEKQGQDYNTWVPGEGWITGTAYGKVRQAAKMLQTDGVPVSFLQQALGKLDQQSTLFGDKDIAMNTSYEDIYKVAKDLYKESKSGKYSNGGNSYTKFLDDEAKEAKANKTKYSKQLSNLLAGKDAARSLPLQVAMDEFASNMPTNKALFNKRIVQDESGNKLLFGSIAEAQAYKNEMNDFNTPDTVETKKQTSKSKSTPNKTGFEDLSKADIKTLFADLDPKKDADVLEDLKKEVINRNDSMLAAETGVFQSVADATKTDPKLLKKLEESDQGLVDQSLTFLPVVKSVKPLYSSIKNSSNFWKNFRPDPKLVQQYFGKSPLAKVLNTAGKAPVSKKTLIDRATILRNKPNLTMPEAEELQALQKLIKAAK